MIIEINKKKKDEIKKMGEDIIKDYEKIDKLFVMEIHDYDDAPILVYYNEIDIIKFIGYLEVVKQNLIDSLRI